MRLLLVLACGVFAAGCVSASWNRELRYAPPAPEAIATLQPGESTLGPCLDALGAPLWVWEYDGDGVALAYGWLEQRGWNVNVSMPVADNFSLSLDYTDISAEMQGLVLLFNAELALVDLRRGLLRDLTRGRPRARPQDVE